MAFARTRDPSAAGRLRLMLAVSALLLLASLALMAGATHAWFTDSVVNEGNAIRAAETFPPPADALGEPQAEPPSAAPDGADEDSPATEDRQPEAGPPPDPEAPAPGEAPSVGEEEGFSQQEAEVLARSEDGG